MNFSISILLIHKSESNKPTHIRKETNPKPKAQMQAKDKILIKDQTVKSTLIKVGAGSTLLIDMGRLHDIFQAIFHCVPES